MSEEQEQPETPVEEFTMDMLLNQQVSFEQVKQAEKDLLLPAGTYTSVPPFEVKFVRGNQDGRPYARFWGNIFAAINRPDGTIEDVQGKIGFSFSWQRKNRIDRETGIDSGKPDNAYKLYVQAVNAFKRAYSEDPSTDGDVVKYVRDYPVRLRLIQVGVPTERNPNPDGEPGTMVVAISAPLSE